MAFYKGNVLSRGSLLLYFDFTFGFWEQDMHKHKEIKTKAEKNQLKHECFNIGVSQTCDKSFNYVQMSQKDGPTMCQERQN